jgi:hypothetical protein
MSEKCPLGQKPDSEKTAFGSCMDAVRTLDPTRPDPTQNRPEEGGGLSHSTDSDKYSPDPFPAQREIWHHLTAGLRMLPPNDHGRDWPNPDRRTLARLLDEFDADLCIRAAREAREIVGSQDRAPNITGLFEKKLRELAGVRSTVRRELEFVSAGGEG